MKLNLLPLSDDAEILRVILRYQRHAGIVGLPWMTHLHLIAEDNDDPRMSSWEGYYENEDWLRHLSYRQKGRAGSVLAKFVTLLRKQGLKAAEQYQDRWYDKAHREMQR